MITIIVLLILVGVSLATLSGEGSIIKNAEEVVAKYNNSVEKEQMALNNIDKFLQTGEESAVEEDANSTSHGKSTLLWEYEFTEADITGPKYIKKTITIDNLDKYSSLYLIECLDITNDDGTINLDESYRTLKNYVPLDIIKKEENRYFGGDCPVKYTQNNLSIMISNEFYNYNEFDNVELEYIMKHMNAKYKLYGVE